MARAIDAEYVERIFMKWLNTLPDGEETPAIESCLNVVKNAPTLTPLNEPLTLEELREMNEVPVWIQNLEEPAKSQWRLLYWDRGKYLVLQGISVRGYLMEEYGESWLAYRRPPEGEEDT
ncbi:hypothetical protein [Evtepia gabavorous]|jgi:hypothetical protein|uniref:hypothetical protein n=1 Tax=Evtepia gabavorous TaxID=2211183 RepID=UPI0015A6E78C